MSFDRNNVVSNMFEYYKDPTVVDKTPIVSFNNETGADAGGLTKEVFSIFFLEIEKLYFTGESAIIPFIPLHKQRKEKHNYVLIGRILDHNLCLFGTMP